MIKMPSCDMCGAQGKLFRVSVEGAELMLCKDCSRFGKVVAAPRIVIKKESSQAKPKKQEEIVEIIVPYCSRLIKGEREKLGLTQEELAKRINEKESIIQKIESGKSEPDMAVAKKLENFLGIKLVERLKEEGVMAAGKKSGPVTIGDVITIKRKAK